MIGFPGDEQRDDRELEMLEEGPDGLVLKSGEQIRVTQRRAEAAGVDPREIQPIDYDFAGRDADYARPA